MTGSLEADLVILGISALFVFLSIVGVIAQVKHRRRVTGDDYSVAEGKIVEVKSEFVKHGQVIQYQSIYEYTAEDGRTYRHVTHDVGQTFRPQIGFTRKIVYKKSDPTQSEFYTNYRGIIMAAISFVCAILVIILGIRGSKIILGL